MLVIDTTGATLGDIAVSSDMADGWGYSIPRVGAPGYVQLRAVKHNGELVLLVDAADADALRATGAVRVTSEAQQAAIEASKARHAATVEAAAAADSAPGADVRLRARQTRSARDDEVDRIAAAAIGDGHRDRVSAALATLGL
jgi:hypothetical protein